MSRTNPDVAPLSSNLEPTTGTRHALFAGKYRVVGHLGRGGMADVFLGATLGAHGIGKLVVIKKMREDRTVDPSWGPMFLSEARIAMRLNHPNVVHTYDVGDEGGAMFLAMEYLEGQTLGSALAAIVHQSQYADVGLACNIVNELLEGLHYAHDFQDYDGTPLGIVHRDVSPQNVLVTYEGRVKVLDFGIAKSSVNEGRTEAGILKGKTGYMAPEQAVGGHVDRRADVFAVGVILWEMLTGERLFKGETAQALIRIVTEDAPRVSSRRPDVPPELDEIVARSLARNVQHRFQTAGEMARALVQFLSTAGLGMRATDVAARLTALFPQGKEQARRRVEACLAEAGVTDAPTSGPGPRMSLSGESAAIALSSTAARPAVTLLDVPSDTRRRRVVMVAGAVGLAALAVTGSLLLRRGSQAPVASQTTLVPSAVAAPAEAATGSPGEQFHLTLSSDPPEAEIEWGGKPVGRTPLMVDLDPGPQSFVVKRDGYFAATILVNITASMGGRTDSRTIVMVPRARVAGNTPPPVAAVAAAAARPDPHAAARAPGAPAPSVVAKPAEIGKELPGAAAPVAPPAIANAVGAVTAAPEPARAAAAEATRPEPAAVAAQAPSVPAATVLPYGPEMTRPKLLSGSDPVYSREARVAGIEGTIIAKCTVTSQGSLANCRILKGLPFMDRAMLDALATRRYTPVTLRGQAVATEYVFSTRIVRPR